VKIAAKTPEPTPVYDSAPPSGRTLKLYLPRTDNYDADVRRMQALESVLRSSTGNDQVTLYLPNGVGIVVLQSQHTVNVSQGLISDLHAVLGQERVILD
jgi:DNA polymerase-3 subunit alpha